MLTNRSEPRILEKCLLKWGWGDQVVTGEGNRQRRQEAAAGEMQRAAAGGAQGSKVQLEQNGQ